MALLNVNVYLSLLILFQSAYGLRIAIPPKALNLESSLPTKPKAELIAIDCGILYGPPNTVLAAKRALQNGADALNIDLILTKDLKLVGMHSPLHFLPYSDFYKKVKHNLGNLTYDSLPKTPSCTTFRVYLAFKGVSPADLNGLTDCEPQAMNTVEEFMEAFPNTPLHFDMKADTLELQFKQKQILEDILYSKFPERAKITDGSFTSVRFFHKPEETVQFSRLHEQSGQNGLRPSLPIFLGDPAGDEDYLQMNGMTAYHGHSAYRTVLSVIERGPKLAPSGVLGAYIALSTLNQLIFSVPGEWQGNFNVICDMPDLEKKSVKDCGSFRRIHTHFFHGVSKKPMAMEFASLKWPITIGPDNGWHFPSQDLKNEDFAFTLRGMHHEGEDLGKPTFTRCAGKVVTATLVLLLQEKGILPGLDEPIVEHLKLPKLNTVLKYWQLDRNMRDWKDHPVLKQLTLRQVMSGVGGIVGIESDDLMIRRAHKSTEALATMALAGIDKKFKPGIDFIYSNQAWIIVERAIEVATGLPFATVARKFLFDPIGMSKNTFHMEKDGPTCTFSDAARHRIGETWFDDADIYNRGYGLVINSDRTIEQVNAKAGIGLCTVTDDWKLFAKTLVNGGKSPKTNTQVISADSISELYVDQLETHFPGSLPKAFTEFPLGMIGRHFNATLSRGLGSYIRKYGGGDSLFAWGGQAWEHNHFSDKKETGNQDLDAALVINHKSLVNEQHTYLTQLTWNELAKQKNTDKQCLLQVFGGTSETHQIHKLKATC